MTPEIERKVDAILKKVMEKEQTPLPVQPPTPEKLVKRISKLKDKGTYICFTIHTPLGRDDIPLHESVHIEIGGWEQEDWVGISDKIAETFMELSLEYNIWDFDSERWDFDYEEIGRVRDIAICVIKSADGTTNITADVIQAFMNIAKRNNK